MKGTGVNPFFVTGFFLYPMKTTENYRVLMFSGVVGKVMWHEID